MSIKDRLLSFARTTGLYQKDIEEAMGMSKGTLGNKCKINSEAISAFLEKYDYVSAEWLMRGEGDMCIKDRMTTEQIFDMYGEKEAMQIVQHNISGSVVNNGGTQTVDNSCEKELSDKLAIIELLKEQVTILKQSNNDLRKSLAKYE